MIQHSVDECEVGVIVGRFQVPKLHAGHMELIQHVRSRHHRLIVVLGSSPIPHTPRNPLDFQLRRLMFTSIDPTIEVVELMDSRCDISWSDKLDDLVSGMLRPEQAACMYGGRDSFIERYKGRYRTIELESTVYSSGTEIRTEAMHRVELSESFRAGVIYATASRYPSVIPTVDVAVFDGDGDKKKIMLVRKHGEDRFRFPGGYCQPNSISHEADARREVEEETGISITNPQYISSVNIDDWRYVQGKDRIRTTLFAAYKQFGAVNIQDKREIAEVKWFNFADLCVSDSSLGSVLPIVPEHHALLRIVEDWTNSSAGSRFFSI